MQAKQVWYLLWGVDTDEEQRAKRSIEKFMTFELYTVYISASKKGKKINNTVQCSAVQFVKRVELIHLWVVRLTRLLNRQSEKARWCGCGCLGWGMGGGSWGIEIVGIDNEISCYCWSLRTP